MVLKYIPFPTIKIIIYVFSNANHYSCSYSIHTYPIEFKFKSYGHRSWFTIQIGARLLLFIFIFCVIHCGVLSLVRFGFGLIPMTDSRANYLLICAVTIDLALRLFSSSSPMGWVNEMNSRTCTSTNTVQPNRPKQNENEKSFAHNI